MCGAIHPFSQMQILWCVEFSRRVTSLVFCSKQLYKVAVKRSTSEQVPQLMIIVTIFFLLAQQPQWAMASSFTRFLGHTQLRTKVSWAPLDERSGRRRGLYLATHNTHNRQKSMTPVGFEPTISAGERPQTYALDRAATRTGD